MDRTVQDKCGSDAQAIPATEAGYHAKHTHQDDDHSDRSDPKVQRNLKVHMFRYNHIGPAQTLASSNVKEVGPQGVKRKLGQQIGAGVLLRSKLQNKMMRNTEKAIEDGDFFYNTVAAEVTTSMGLTFLRNLKRDIARLSFSNPQDQDVQRFNERLASESAAKAAFTSYKHDWLQDLNDSLTELRQEHSAMESGNLERALQKLIERVQSLRDTCHRMNFDHAYTRVENVPKHISYYHQFSGEEKVQFWKDLWNKDTAASFYHPYKDVVCVSECFDSKRMGQFMLWTWMSVCTATWAYVIAPRLENERVKQSPDRRAATRINWDIKTRVPYSVYQNIQKDKFSNKAWAKKGIELVLVPKPPAVEESRRSQEYSSGDEQGGLNSPSE